MNKQQDVTNHEVGIDVFTSKRDYNMFIKTMVGHGRYSIVVGGQTANYTELLGRPIDGEHDTTQKVVYDPDGVDTTLATTVACMREQHEQAPFNIVFDITDEGMVDIATNETVGGLIQLLAVLAENVEKINRFQKILNADYQRRQGEAA